MPNLDRPEITALRQAIRACFRTGSGYEGLVDVLATEDELWAQAQRAAGVPPPVDFEEQWAALTVQRQQEAAQRLAALGGTMPDLEPAPQREMW